MRVLFDQATPVPIRAFLTGHYVSTAAREGRAQLKNADLLDAAEAAAFDVFVTTDKNLKYQQNLNHRRIAIVVLHKQQWPELKVHAHLVVDAVNGAKPGTCVDVEMPK